jgi:hypothetical protein
MLIPSFHFIQIKEIFIIIIFFAIRCASHFLPLDITAIKTVNSKISVFSKNFDQNLSFQNQTVLIQLYVCS